MEEINTTRQARDHKEYLELLGTLDNQDRIAAVTAAFIQAAQGPVIAATISKLERERATLIDVSDGLVSFVNDTGDEFLDTTETLAAEFSQTLNEDGYHARRVHTVLYLSVEARKRIEYLREPPKSIIQVYDNLFKLTRDLIESQKYLAIAMDQISETITNEFQKLISTEQHLSFDPDKYTSTIAYFKSAIRAFTTHESYLEGWVKGVEHEALNLLKIDEMLRSIASTDSGTQLKPFEVFQGSVWLTELLEEIIDVIPKTGAEALATGLSVYRKRNFTYFVSAVADVSMMNAFTNGTDLRWLSMQALKAFETSLTLIQNKQFKGHKIALKRLNGESTELLTFSEFEESHEIPVLLAATKLRHDLSGLEEFDPTYNEAKVAKGSHDKKGRHAIHELTYKLLLELNELKGTFDDFESGCQESEETELEFTTKRDAIVDVYLKAAQKLLSDGNNEDGANYAARISKAKESGNFAFDVNSAGGDHGELSFTRVPPGNISYHDVIGSSWKEILKRIEGVLEYNRYGLVYSRLSQRGKFNANTLIIGPYGIGKNEFGRALKADPRASTYSVTTDKLDSVWHSMAEKNVRSLFEEAQRQHHRTEKPSLIMWDEIDSVFDSSGSTRSNVHDGMKKTLQTVLDGDIYYEGTSLIAFSNEPQKIPVPIYRRFGAVHVIPAFTTDDRLQLIRYFLTSLPCDEFVNSDLELAEFIQGTDHASGETIGKIYDRAFELYIDQLKAISPRKLENLNGTLRKYLATGAELSANTRRQFIQKHFKDQRLSKETFDRAVKETLNKSDIQLQMQQQRKFYKDVEALMAEAFSGSL